MEGCLFAIEVDDGSGLRPATAAEVAAALRQRELFGVAEYPARPRVGLADSSEPPPADRASQCQHIDPAVERSVHTVGKSGRPGP